MRIQDYPPPARTLSGNELLPAIQDGANVALSTADLVNLAATTVNAYLAQAISLFNVQLGSGGATFSRFVDTVTGSDAGGSYDGTTPAKAWRSFASYAALGTGIAGLPLGVARGSSTQSAAGTQISLTASNVRIGGYGDPALGRPIFDSSILLPNASFTADGTYANQWNIAVSGLTVGTKNIGNGIYRDPATGKYRILKQYASKAAMNTAGGDGFVAPWTTSGTASATGTATVRLAAGSPLTNGIEYRITNGVGLEIIGDGAVVTDVICRNNAHQDGSLRIAGATATVRRCRIENGSRHNAYSYVDNATWEDNYFVGGDNQVESSQGMNGLVLNQPDMTGKSFTLRRNTYDCDGYVGASGQINHDSTTGHLCGPALMEDEIYIGMAQCFASASTALAARRPVFQTHVASGITCNSITSIASAGADTTISNATGVLNRATDSSAAGTLRLIGSVLTVPDLGAGSVGFYRVNSASGDLAIQSTNETLTISPIASNPNGTLKPIAYMQRGSFKPSGSKYQLANGETMGHDMTHGWYGGFSGGTFAATGGSSIWPYAVAFTINGTTYPTLAAAQAAGYEAGSTQQLPKAPILTDLFEGASAALETIGWTQLSGTAGTLARNGSGVLATTANTEVAYRLGNLSQPNGQCYGIADTGNMGLCYLTMMMVDKNNWIGVHNTGTAYVVSSRIGGTFSQLISSAAITPAAGDVMRMAVRVIDAVAGKIFVQLIVNDRLLGSATVTNTTLAAQTGCGFYAWQAAQTELRELGFGNL